MLKLNFVSEIYVNTKSGEQRFLKLYLSQDDRKITFKVNNVIVKGAYYMQMHS